MQNCQCRKNVQIEKSSIESFTSQLSDTYLCFAIECAGVLYCRGCEENHQSHLEEFFNVEKGLQMLEELLYRLKRSGSSKIGQLVQMLQKYKLMETFKNCIDKKWKQLEKELLVFLNSTQSLIHEYSINKNKVEKDIDYIDEGNCPLKLYSSYYINQQNQSFQIKENRLINLEKEWDSLIVCLMNHQSQLKDYSIKMVEIITDDEIYESAKYPNSHSKLNLYSKLHEEIKNKLLEKQQFPKIRKINSLETTQEDLLGISNQKIKCSLNIEKVNDEEDKKVEEKKSSKKKAESKMMIRKLLDIFGVRQK